MARVRELRPGDQVEIVKGKPATFVGMVDPHPIYPVMVMVVWHFPKGHPLGDWPDRYGAFSFDALSAGQDVGPVVESTAEQRLVNVRNAILWSGF